MSTGMLAILIVLVHTTDEDIYLYDIILALRVWIILDNLADQEIQGPGLFNVHEFLLAPSSLPPRFTMPFNPNLYLLQQPFDYGGQPSPWTDLKFNPLGLYSLRQRLGMLSDQRGIFTRYQQSFLASDLAWFAAGASEDKTHHVQPNTFHSLFGVSRENTPAGVLGNKLRAGIRQHLRQLTFDLATTWDRAYGGSTLVIHVEGATIPGAPNLPEYLKADVYLPPHLVDERAECHLPIAAIVQTFIEEIGIHTVNRYIAAGRKFGWTFTQNQGYAKPSSQNLALIPPPTKTGSAHYVFHGRPYGSLPSLGLPPQHSNSDQHQPMPAGPTASKSSPSIDGDFEDEPDHIEFAMINAAEKIADLESGLERAALMEAEYIKEITSLRNELAETYAILRQQEARSAENISCSSTQCSPSLSYRVSPFATPQPSKGKYHAVPDPSRCQPSVTRFPQLTSLAYISNPSHPEKVLNLSGPRPIHRETPRRTKPKQEESVTTILSSNLGPVTTEFITTNDLTRFGQILNLIVANHPPTKWSAMLRVLSLPDDVYDDLLDAMTADLERGKT